MNKEFCLKLADVIEEQKHTNFSAPNGFCQDNYTHSCGTPACIAGFAIALAVKDINKSIYAHENGSYKYTAANLLGISIEQANELFLRHPPNVEPHEAATLLRIMVETGSASWDLIREMRRQTKPS